MSRYLRRFLAAAATALALPVSASSTLTPNYTDLWLTPTEQGWGVNIIQHYDTMFVTLFVYGPNGTQPTWYHGSAVRTVGASQTQFSGQLFATVGSPFTAPWNPSSFAITPVGTISFNFPTPTSGTLTYNVSPNPTLTKSIVRHTLAGNVIGGNYIGGITGNGTNCGNGVPNGPILISGEVSINQSSFFNPTFRIDWGNQLDRICTFTGPYTQEGRYGSVNGTWSCSIPGVSNPPVGTFSFTQLEASMTGISGRFTGNDQNCTYNGFFGGVRDVL